MKPTEILIKEHDAILLMLDIISAVCKRLEKGTPVAPEHLPQIVEFIRVFADKCHHGKEETLLFESMIKSGMRKESGPIAVMLSEHETGRELVGRMGSSAAAFASGDHSAANQFIQSARGYVALLTQHIHKENQILFPMADKIIKPEEQNRLLVDFDRVETEVVGEGVHERFHELLHRLRAEYLE